MVTGRDLDDLDRDEPSADDSLGETHVGLSHLFYMGVEALQTEGSTRKEAIEIIVGASVPLKKLVTNWAREEMRMHRQTTANMED